MNTMGRFPQLLVLLSGCLLAPEDIVFVAAFVLSMVSWAASLA